MGEGYSGIVYERGVLFTIYRENGDDVVVALRGDNGATIWEYRYPFKSYAGNDHQYGSGPNATPLILEDRGSEQMIFKHAIATISVSRTCPGPSPTG